MMKIEIKGDGLAKIEKALEELSDAQGKRAMARAMNEVGKTMRGKVVRAVAKQVGVSQSTVVKRGNIRSTPARTERLEYRVSSAGGHMKLKDFKPKQNEEGVASGPWGRRRMFGGAFMGPRPGLTGVGLKGHVFHRTGEVRMMKKGAYKGKMRQPIENMFGPAVPKEIVKDQSEVVFREYGEQRLPVRIMHHIRQTTKGTFS